MPSRFLVVGTTPTLHEELDQHLGMGGTQLVHVATLPEALSATADAIGADGRFLAVFIDVRAPMGREVVEHVSALQSIDSQLTTCLCPASGDETWLGIAASLTRHARVIVAKQPFFGPEVMILAHNLEATQAGSGPVLEATVESQVVERTQQLEAARDAAFAATAKSEFLATMSHEIQAPLSNVNRILDCLTVDEDLLSPLINEQLDLLHTLTETMLEHASDVIDFSRLESSQLRLNCAPFDVCKAVEDSVLGLETRARHQQVRIRHTVHENTPRQVVGDATRVQQILESLLANTIDNSAPGDVTLDVRPSPGASGLAIEVRYSGTREPPCSMEDLLASHAGRHKGLRIAVAKALAQAMGGDIELTPAGGASAVFAVHLVLSEEAHGAKNANLERRFEGLRVLLVEDNPVNRQVGVRVLQRLGCETTTANNGVEGLEALRTNTFDVVLLDCRMPVMNGYEMVRRIRGSLKEWREIPVIALTAETLAANRQRCLELGMNACAFKPIRPVQLSAVLSEVVETKQAA